MATKAVMCVQLLQKRLCRYECILCVLFYTHFVSRDQNAQIRSKCLPLFQGSIGSLSFIPLNGCDFVSCLYMCASLSTAPSCRLEHSLPGTDNILHILVLPNIVT